MKLKGNEWAVAAAGAELAGAKRIASAAKILHAANTKKSGASNGAKHTDFFSTDNDYPV